MHRRIFQQVPCRSTAGLPSTPIENLLFALQYDLRANAGRNSLEAGLLGFGQNDERRRRRSTALACVCSDESLLRVGVLERQSAA